MYSSTNIVKIAAIIFNISTALLTRCYAWKHNFDIKYAGFSRTETIDYAIVPLLSKHLGTLGEDYALKFKEKRN